MSRYIGFHYQVALTPTQSTQQRFSDGSPVKGLMLLQDTQLIETLAHFSRERIPARVVHAHASGAWG